jgi:hypothetical protein
LFTQFLEEEIGFLKKAHDILVGELSGGYCQIFDYLTHGHFKSFQSWITHRLAIVTPGKNICCPCISVWGWPVSRGNWFLMT